MPFQPHKQTYYGKFGRYEGSRDAPFPRQAFLIGRERERAHLMDLLYMKAGLGSFLITGPRGVGKTTFVRYCISTYVRDVYERFSRSLVGRSLTDRALFAGAVWTLLLLMLVSARVLAVLVAGLPMATAPRAVLSVLVGLISLMFVGAPVLLAYRTSTSTRIFMKALAGVLGAIAAVGGAAALIDEGLGDTCRGALDVLVVGLPAALIGILWSRRLPSTLHPRNPGELEELRGLVYAAGRVSCLRVTTLLALFFWLIALAVHERVPTGDTLCIWESALDLACATVWTIALYRLLRIERMLLLQPARRILFEPAFSGARGDASHEEYHKLHHRLAISAESTLFSRVFDAWLPIIRVPVNLGLDTLAHRHVIEAMLHGLRVALRRTCLDANTPLGLVRQGARMVLTLLSFSVLHQLLNKPAGVVTQTVRGLLKLDTLASVTGAIDDRSVVPLLGMHEHPSMAAWLAPSRVTLLDLLVLLLLWLSWAWISRVAPVLSHARIEQQITSVLSTLTSRITQQQDTLRVGHEKVLSVAVGGRSVVTEPRDPRSLEQAFLEILESLRTPRLHVLPGIAMSLPASEVLFVFDELDKVGTNTSLVDSDDEPAVGQRDDVDQERNRSRKLQALLADLKNLLCTAPARFFFVGGRNLHDEWLADEVNRSPLLTNIFDAAIYLRSMLTDHNRSGDTPPDITASVEQYLSAQKLRAEKAWDQWFQSAGAGRRDRSVWVIPPAFAVPTGGFTLALTANHTAVGAKAMSLDATREFDRHFIKFITFRSRGIHRRARLLLENFVRPYDRNVHTPLKSGHARPAQHVLYFADSDRHRIELVSELLEATQSAMLEAMGRRDDKILMAVLQFADFLARFHRGAFSLQSLERFEELMHIHRDPDTSTVAARLIEGWLGQLLEPTSSGIYAYRFRAEWAAEIGYLARTSRHESAAFNFTLDESQALKTQLRAMLARMAGGGGAYETQAALGELHDLDGDHLEARHNLRSAVAQLDTRLGQEFDKEGTGHIARIFEPANRVSAIRQLDWGLARLKLMLQIGVSYERTFDYQRASLEYGNACQLARHLAGVSHSHVRALSGAPALLLEPMFALAWAALKDPSDTGSPLEIVATMLPRARPLTQAPGSLAATRESFERVKEFADALAPALGSRLLANFGTLAMFAYPAAVSIAGKDAVIEVARGAFERAHDFAEKTDNWAQQSLCDVCVVLCALLGSSQRNYIQQSVFDELGRVVYAVQKATRASSGRGSASDSTAVCHFALELIEELALVSSRLHVQRQAYYQGRRHDLGRLQFEVWKACKSSRERWLRSPLRRSLLNQAYDRAKAATSDHVKDLDYSDRAFPMRNRLLNMRSAVALGNSDPELFTSMVTLWKQFDQSDLLAGCRLSLGIVVDSKTGQPEFVVRMRNISHDIALGGKRYYAFLRDRFYLEDGFGPLPLRLNFALLVGLDGCYEEIYRAKEHT